MLEFLFVEKGFHITQVWPQTPYIAKDDLELLIFQTLPPQCWFYTGTPPYLVYEVWWIQYRASCTLSKLSSHHKINPSPFLDIFDRLTHIHLKWSHLWFFRLYVKLPLPFCFLCGCGVCLCACVCAWCGYVWCGWVAYMWVYRPCTRAETRARNLPHWLETRFLSELEAIHLTKPAD